MTVHNPFAASALAAFYPITESQREIWLAANFEPQANLGYNEGLCISLDGPLNESALRAALQAVVDRHEALRARFSPDGSHVLVAQSSVLDVPFVDLSAEADPAAALARLEAEQMARPFVLDQGPLLHFTLVRLSAESHRLLFIAHHLVCDGWSGAVVITEIGALYSAAVEGRVFKLPPAPRFGDYGLVEHRFLGSETGQQHRQYWRETLQASPVSVALPGDRPRPPQRSFEADRVDRPITADTVSRIRALGAGQGASLVATLLATFAAQLHRLSGAEDMVIGLAAAGQSFHDRKGLVGHCVNLLPLRLRPTADQPFSGFLSDVRSTVMDAFEHQGTTFGSLLPELDIERDETRPPLIAVVFNIDVRNDDIRHSGLQVGYRTLVRQAETFDWFINLVDDGQSLLIEASYNRALYSRAWVEALLDRFQTLLDGVCRTPDAALKALPLVSPEVRETLVTQFNPAPRPFADETLSAAVLRTAAAHPAAPAVSAWSDTLRYDELVHRAQSIAVALQARGAERERIIAVLLPRGVELPTTILGVLFSGAAYLPLDPELPPERLRFMLEDAQVIGVIAPEGGLDWGQDAPCPVWTLPELVGDASRWQDSRRPDSLAYVIYTSGSTGQPKGTLITDANAVNFIRAVQEAPGLPADGALLAVSTIAFDFSVCDLLLPWFSGARLVMADRETQQDGARLAEALAREGITYLQGTPSMWRLLIGSGWNGTPGLTAVSGGEALPPDLVAELLPRVGSLWNIYGPTECTVWATGAQITDPNHPVVIGRPIANVRVYLLDAQGEPVPVGVVGEICIAGAGVGRGYLRRPELDAATFVADPFGPGRLYRTGDLGRYQPDGNLECLGRRDHQVKLRGFRIELGEIESALTQSPDVGEAVVALRRHAAGDDRLVAWVAPTPGALLNVQSLRNGLRRRLPTYMVPQTLRVLPTLPRLVNGKLNRHALPDPFADELAPPTAREAPRGAHEQAVAAILAGVMARTSLSRDDRLYDLGGHSLLATEAAGRLARTFGPRLPLRAVMMQTVAEIAAALPQQAAAPSTPEVEPPAAVEVAPAESPTPPTRRGWLPWGKR